MPLRSVISRGYELFISPVKCIVAFSLLLLSGVIFLYLASCTGTAHHIAYVSFLCDLETQK